MTNCDIELPKYPYTAELGEKGVRMVADAVEDELHWIFRPNTKADVGIDGEIEFIQDDRKSTGHFLAVQIKCGPSFFEEKTERGIIFRCRPETVNYWLELSLPVILCLCDNTVNTIYWCHITVETVHKLGRNYKIEVPYENVLNRENKDRLKWVIDSVVPMESIANAAVYMYLYERFKHNVRICPIMEEPRDFHGLSYIMELKGELHIVGTVIDRYGYFDEDELLKKIRLYKENRRLCGWDEFDTKSKFMIFFVSESAKNLKLPERIMEYLIKNESFIRYERLLLSKTYISATLIAENGDEVLLYDENGTGDFTAF